MDNCRIIELVSHGDNRGSLIALEKEHNVPFDIKRVYYIYDTKICTTKKNRIDIVSIILPCKKY